MARRRRKLYGVDELSVAELAWLTGDESKVEPQSWDEFFLWSLKRGFASHQKGRAMDAHELLETYGHLASSERRKYLRLQIQRMNRACYTRDGRISRRPFKTAEITTLGAWVFY